MISKEKIIDKKEILESGHIQIREATVIKEDGVELSRSFHRYFLFPGEDIDDQPKEVTDICNLIWTPEVVQRYLDSLPEEEDGK